MAIYNNPALGQAFNNIASAFAPPSGSDLYGYANAAATQEKAARLSQLFNAAGSADFNQQVFDRQAVAAGLYNPTQGYYAQDQNNSTAMRGQDVTAATSRANNAADNERALVAAVMQAASAPVAQGAVRPGFNPADYGVKAPAVSEFAGATAPLSETQWAAQQNQRLLDKGSITDEMLIDQIMGERTPVQIVGPDNRPQFASPGAAVRTGAEPFLRSTGSTETKNYRTANGAVGSAFFDSQSNEWRDTATQQPLPQGAITFNSSLQGGAEETGLAPTTANTTNANSMAATLDAMDADIDALSGLLDKNPGIAGLPGTIFGAAQNAGSVLGEMSAAFGGMAPDAKITVDQAQKALQTITPARNPAIQQFNMGIANLAYRLAKMNNPSGEVSRQAYERALESLSGGVLGNNQSAKEALGALKDQVQRNRETELNTLRNPGQSLLGTNSVTPNPPAPGAPPAPPSQGEPRFATNPTTGERLQLINGQWVPVQ